MTPEVNEFYRFDGIELARIRASRHASFPLHTHAEYVVSANLAGCEHVCVDGKKLRVTERRVTVYNPEAMQSSTFDASAGDSEFISLYIDPDKLVRIGRSNGWLSHSLPPALDQGVFSSPNLYQGVLTAYRAAADDSRDADFETAIIELTATLLTHRDRAIDTIRPALSRHELGPVLESMRTQLSAPITLDVLSAVANVNKYQLIRSFKAVVGMTPARYHMQLRLIEARSRLRRGFTVQDVAFDLGFYDQSHLINAFRKVLGVSPLRFAEPQRFIRPGVRE
ncbi:helix-turn-helix transcriptional regulator [Paraburkholderia humisilvae]|uniref:HTH-type transcriptional activator RhaS n=1 Tax=Paraburkholderia humisilvae TaxID=627669 RepID=A0A6J5DH41_9BURK|nr:AraC family transcriptional regulator [Paraburkholderia humisilvae]CAB3752492.1 HTH-type transcriptional activator RhaS [Paraburkholderia humisilvae]